MAGLAPVIPPRRPRRRPRRRPVRTAGAAASLLLAGACTVPPPEPATESFPSMGTRASVTVADDDRERLASLSGEVRTVLERVESRLSTYRSASEISRLTAMAGRSPVPVSEDTHRVLELCRHYGALTGGAFDVTVAPLVHLWGFREGPLHTPPAPERIEERLARVDFRRIELGEGTAFLPAGMSLDLGGIGKGFAVDEAVEVLRRSGVRGAMLDLGGNIRVLGQADAGVSWTIGVRDPYERGQVLGTVSLGDGMAIATSGSYERFVEMAGRRHSHILDPRTGYPVEGMAGVTVVAPSATAADALSTGLFVLGVPSGVEIIRRLPGVDVLFVPDRNPVEMWLTPGMETLFRPRPELTSSVRILPALGPRQPSPSTSSAPAYRLSRDGVRRVVPPRQLAGTILFSRAGGAT